MTPIWTVDKDDRLTTFFALLGLSIDTHRRIVAGERSRIRQSEETITETILLELSISLPNLRISTHSRRKESRSGADWEWWIEGNTRWFGMLVQAKKLHAARGHPNGGYGFGYAPQSASGELQVDRLIYTAEHRASPTLAPIYVLYNGTDKTTSQVQCPFRTLDQHELAGGITAMSAYTVRALAEKNISPRRRYQDVPLEQVSPHAIPWSCLATCGTSCETGYGGHGTPPLWDDAQFKEYDPASRAAAAVNMLIAQFPRSDERPNDIPPEARLHAEPPSYVPPTMDRWSDAEPPTSQLASHMAVLYRNRRNTNQ
ncbi:hypothetical protein QM588_22265 [Rhodococcus sp. IEGM 1354]|uniref:DUF6615 family protein n=1 Tax=Rhodococcus sp. IEGM 1354 TaxID=3047088 RepID=UPI0024B638D6|nr:DUF6615 family protein [Rhodococcus sp. IEGM 1354]MDI9933152.1 hypothetical protein [Rhodococcus sp. IEGM 1354]